MGHSGDTTRGFDSGELRAQLENALGDFLGERDPATLQQLFADVMASLNGATVSERLGQEHGGDVDPAIDLGLGRARAEEGDSSMEELREPSAQVGRYSLHGELARGGMGVVLRVWDRELRRTLAMKVAGGDGSVGKPTRGRTADS